MRAFRDVRASAPALRSVFVRKRQRGGRELLESILGERPKNAALFRATFFSLPDGRDLRPVKEQEHCAGVKQKLIPVPGWYG